MTNASAEVQLLLTAKDQASKVLKDVEGNAHGFGKVLGDVGKIASGFLAAEVIGGGIQKLTGFIGDSIAAIKESNLVNAQLEAVLKSTGNAAGVTADEVRDHASALEKMSLFEDEAILNGQNLLLTFTNIGRDTFPRATQAIVDMSQALGQDMKSSAIQLGKALNDPIKGVTALSRVGVSFTEEQKEQIKVMTEAGNVAGAQALILAELEKEFGGSAQAASDAAGATEKYKDRMNDLQEQIGAKMLPIQEKLNEVKLKMVALIADKVIPKLEELYVKHWPAISKAINDVVVFIQANWPTISAIIEFGANFVIAKIQGLIQVIQSIIGIVQGVIDLVSALFHGEWAAAWEAFKSIGENVLNLFLGTLKYIFGNIPGIIWEQMSKLPDIVTNAFNGILDGAIRILRSGVNQIIDLINSAIRAYNSLPLAPDIGTVQRLFEAGPITGGGGYGPGDLAGEMAGGSSYVPRTAPYLLHQGERVITAEENARGGAGAAVNFYGPVTIQARDRADAERGAGDMAWGLNVALRVRGQA